MREKPIPPAISVKCCERQEGFIPRQSPEMFLNMMEIHALLGAFEPILRQIPYPDGAVSEDQNRLGSAKSSLERLGVQLSLETGNSFPGSNKVPHG